MVDVLIEEDDFYFDKWEQDDLEFQRELDQLNNGLDITYMSMELYHDLIDLISNTNKKIDLLKGLKHETIREQFLIDLFLSELVSIFEGFIFSYLAIFKNYLKVIEYDADNIKSVLHAINFKNDEWSLRGLLSEKSKKTLNDPITVKKLFTVIFKLTFDIPYTSIITKKFLSECINIRNAHVHKNGSHEKEPRTLEQVNELMIFYVKFLNNLNVALLAKLSRRLEF